MSNSEALLTISMHQEIFEAGYCITRVPGGWIYRYEHVDYIMGLSDVSEPHTRISTVFVPYTVEPLIVE